MKIFFKSFFLFLFVILFFGCDDIQTKNEVKQDIYIRQNIYEYFQSTNEKIDNTFNRKKFYIPAYSHIYISENNYVKLSISLSIRNTDSTKDLYVESIDYYNTEGKLVKQYLSQPHVLKPMATIDYVITLEDMTGGNGAKFLVNVATKNKTSLPIIQAIMTNTFGNSYLSFLTEGHIVE